MVTAAIQPANGKAPAETATNQNRLKSIWWAYIIAPAVAPVSFAVFFFVLGMAALAANPNDTGTPAGVLMVPALSLTVGVLLAYLVVGVIGMPIVLQLEKRSLLNAYTIYAAAVTTSLLFILLSCSLLYALGPVSNGSIGNLMAMGTGLFLFSMPSVLASATVFWWIVARGFHGMSLTALIGTITLTAIFLGLAAPLIRLVF